LREDTKSILFSLSWIDILGIEIFFGIQGEFFVTYLGYHGGNGAALNDDAA
jgi:hypothetical protein